MSGGRKIIFLLGLTAVIMASFALWRWWLDIPPSTRPVWPDVPSVSAFEVYVSAGSTIKEPKVVEWAASPEPKNDPRITCAASVDPSDWPRPARATMAEKRKLVRENAANLAWFRRGFRYRYRSRPITSFRVLNPELAHFRRLADLLTLEAQVRMDDGNWRGAMESCLDCMRFAMRIPVGGGCSHGACSAEVQTRARRTAWGVVDHLDKAELSALLKQIEWITRSAVSYSDTLKVEKRQVQGNLLEVFRHREWRSELADTLDFSCFDDPGLGRSKRLAYTISERRLYAETSKIFDDMIAAMRLPYARRLPAPQGSSDMFHAWLFLDFYLGCGMNTPSRCFYEYNRAMNGLLTTAMALRAWRLDHGRYPPSLKELAPAYLAEVPTDPFSMGAVPVYNRKGAGYVLYSLGPDCKDSGGKPVDPRLVMYGNGPVRFDIVGAKGDLVVEPGYRAADRVPAPKRVPRQTSEPEAEMRSPETMPGSPPPGPR